MDDKQWKKFFAMLYDVVRLDVSTAAQRAELIQSKALEFGAEADLEEFAGLLTELE